jgi:hypothetical protein
MHYQKKQIHRFPKGNNAYRDFLDSLTPEEYTLHLDERRKRKSMRAAMERVQNEYQDVWVSQLHNAAFRCLEKAMVHGDPVAFATVFDRIVGKPMQKIEVNSDEKPLPFSDDLLGD